MLGIVSAVTVGGLAAGVALFNVQAASAAPENLVRNSGFERGTAYWNSPKGAVSRVAGAHSGDFAAAVRPTGGQTGVLNDTPNTVRRSSAGQAYAVSAWVRTAVAPGTLRLRIREVRNGVEIKRTTDSVNLKDTGWHRLALSHVAMVTGSALDLDVIAPKASTGGTFMGFAVDDVKVFERSGPAPSATEARPAPATTVPRPAQSATTAPRPAPSTTAPRPAWSATVPARPSPAEQTPAPAPNGRCAVDSDLVPSCGVLWGGYVKPGSVPGTDNWLNAYTGMESRVGRRFDIVKRYHDFSNAGGNGAFPDAAERALAAQGRIPHFAWVSKNYSTGAVATWADIAAGRYDAAVVDPVARRLKSYGGKVFLDFDHEMDGVTRSGNGTPAGYAAAYRHIHDRFEALEVTNVVWVWVPTGYLGNEAKIAGSYPGDAYVDWIGYDPYNFASCHGGSWRDYETVISGFYDWLMARGHGNKPFMLAEYGSVAHHADASARAAWFRGQVAALKKHPNIKAIQLFNSSDGGSCDAEISRDPAALDAWGDSGRDPYFRVAH